MENFSLTKDSNFKDIEEAFDFIEENKDLIICLPNSLEEKGVFGLEGLVCQLIATWLRNNEGESTLKTFAKEPLAEEFEGLSSSLYGICALRLADHILTDSDVEVTTNTALEMAFNRVRKVISGSFEDAYNGTYLAIPSIKSIGANREFNNPFYNNDRVIGKDGFRKLIDHAMDVVVPQPERKKIIENIKGSVSEIVRELFDNTHKHGRENEIGDVLPTNFRGLILNAVDVTEKRLDKLVRSGIPALVGFNGEWVIWMKKYNRDLPVLDITIVDAGPGYARRWTGKSKFELSLEEEVSSVVSCFKKNNTTSPNLADGSGLTHVLTDLKKLRGWFRLRTGSVAVSRSFFDGEGSISINKKDVVKAGAFIEGVSFNIVIPLVDITKVDY